MLSSFVWATDAPISLTHSIDPDDAASSTAIATNEPPRFSLGRRRGRARKEHVRRIGLRDLPQYEIALKKLLAAHQLTYATTHPLLSLPSSSSTPSHSSSLSTLEDTVAWLEGKPGLDPAEGHLCHWQRARRKRQQVANLLLTCNLYVQHLLSLHQPSPNSSSDSPLTVVEFCCGSGHVALPLAALYPSVHFICVDTRPASIHQAQERAAAAHLTNVECRVGDVHQFSTSQSFHLGIALHACGPLTDAVMDLCLGQRAAFVLCPCCIGNIKANKSKLEYPRSRQFQAVFPDRRQYEALASAADISVRQFSALAGENEKTQHRRRRLCKSYVESDRGLRAEEAGYKTHLMLLTPRECTPKNDLLFGHPAEWGGIGEQGGGEKRAVHPLHLVMGDEDAAGFDAWFGDPAKKTKDGEEEDEEEEDEEEVHDV